MTSRVWITDGSQPVYSDLHQLRAGHRNLYVLRANYEGFVDPVVPRGAASIIGEWPDDALFVEAEWYVEFPEGIDRYRREPHLVESGTPIVLQGLIEGKWFNRLLGTEEWRPASLGNNLIAAGPGIPTTVGALEGGAQGQVQVSYLYRRGGAHQVQVHKTTVADLRGHNVMELLRDVLRVCRETGQEIDGIDLGAFGQEAATVNERRRMLASSRSEGPVPFLDPRYVRAPHRAKERIVSRALAEGFGVPPGNEVTIVTRDGAGAIVGRGALTWRRGPAGPG